MWKGSSWGREFFSCSSDRPKWLAQGLVVMEEVVLVVVVERMVKVVGGNRGKDDGGLWEEVVRAVVVAVVWDAVKSGEWCCRWCG